MRLKFFIFLTYSLCYLISNAQQCNTTVRSGEGTFYGGIAGSEGGNCSLPVAVGDFMHCAMNNVEYDGSNACGACIEVTGVRGKVTLQVVDRCPECKSGDVDLTQQAFAKVANPNDGRVPISWKYVPCPLAVNKNIKINFKSGSSRFYTAIQFRNLRHAVVKMEYFKNNAWINVRRKLYNFFEEPTGITTPMRLRITSVLGERLIFNNVPINTNTDFDTKVQFSTPVNCQGGNTPPPTGNTFFIINRKTGMKIRPKNREDASSIIQIEATAKGGFVRWREVPTSGGYFYLQNVETGKYFRPETNNERALLQQRPTSFSGGYTQWRKVMTSNGYFHLQNRQNNKYIRPVNNKINSSVEQRGTSFVGDYTQWTFQKTSSKTIITENRSSLEVSLFNDNNSRGLRIAIPKAGNVLVGIYTISGQEVFSESYNIKASKTLLLKNFFQEKTTGVYIIKIEYNGLNRTLKVSL